MRRVFAVRSLDGTSGTLEVSDEPWKGELNVTDMEEIDPADIEAGSLHKRGLPAVILRTERLLIREFALSDLPALRELRREAEERAETEDLGPDDAGFSDEAFLSAYIRCQYPFFGFGMWAVTERGSGRLIGKAGLCPERGGVDAEGSEMATGGEADTGRTSRGGANTGLAGSVEAGTGTAGSREADRQTAGAGDTLELSYQIGASYRGRGYALEACRAILTLASRTEGVGRVLVRIRRGNVPSIRLSQRLETELLEAGSGEKQASREKREAGENREAGKKEGNSGTPLLIVTELVQAGKGRTEPV